MKFDKTATMSNIYCAKPQKLGKCFFMAFAIGGMQKRVLSSTCCFLLFTQIVFAQTIVKVSQIPGEGDYSDLQLAIEGSAPGSTLMIYPGTYPTVTLNKPLSIIGTGFEHLTDYPEIKTFPTISSIGGLTCTSACAGSYITGLSIGGLNVSDVQNLIFSRNSIASVYASNALNVIIEESLIGGGWIIYSGYNRTNVYITNDCNLVIRNCLFSQPYYSTSVLYGNRCVKTVNCLNCNIEVDNCVFLNQMELYASSGVRIVKNSIGATSHGWLTGQTAGTNTFLGVNAFDYFVGYPTQGGYTFDSRFQLKPTAPAKNAATHGGDCGIFGGSDPYKLGGLPNIPIIYELNVPSSAPGGSTLNINIKARSEN